MDRAERSVIHGDDWLYVPLLLVLWQSTDSIWHAQSQLSTKYDTEMWKSMFQSSFMNVNYI